MHIVQHQTLYPKGHDQIFIPCIIFFNIDETLFDEVSFFMSNFKSHRWSSKRSRKIGYPLARVNVLKYTTTADTIFFRFYQRILKIKQIEETWI